MPRKPIPTNLKLLKGTARKHRMNKKEPKPNTNFIRRPAHLSPEAAKHWTKICRQLKECGVMTSLDVDALAIYCESFARWVYANSRLVKEGMIIEYPNGTLGQSPYLQISNKAYEQMRKMLVEFGMTPSSRTKVQSQADANKDNPWADFE